MKIKHSDRDVEIKFWYPAVTVQAKAKGQRKQVVVEATEPGHVMFEGRLLCGARSEKLIKDTFVIYEGRLANNPFCEKCVEAYKKADWSPWKKWVEGTPDHGK